MRKVKKFFINNYQLLWCFVLLSIILVVAIDPSPFISSTFAGLRVWATIVLPSLFCFFIFTKLLMQNKSTLKIFSVLDKLFSKLYNTPHFGGYIFAMSAFSGYPIGAKLISEFYEQGLISDKESHKLCAYCSTSGPMFVIGSVAISLFANAKIGIVVFASHLISALLNGLIYRKYEVKKAHVSAGIKINSNLNKNEQHTNELLQKVSKQNTGRQFEIKKQTLNDIMQNTITSVLMVGGFIAISFTLLEIVKATNIFKPIYMVFDKLLPNSSIIFESIFNGVVELTNGCVSLSKIANFSPLISSVILSGMVSFGGLSIHLQSYSFLSKCKIKYKYFLITKLSHAAISVVLAIILGVIIL